jgi:hypothetical protein
VTQQAGPDTRPYLHPIAAPDGRGVLTEASPEHHPHQTGLYFGFTRMNGRDYFHNRGADYWRRVSVTVLQGSGTEVRWQTVYDLLDEAGAAVLRETQRWSMREQDGRFLLDLTWRGEARRDITIANNLFLDLDGKRWGGPGDFMQIGRGAANVTVERNTVQHSGRIVALYGKVPVTGFVFTRNVVRHNKYGVMGDNASPGTLTFERYLRDPVFEQNVIAGGDRRRYPANNEFIAAEALDAPLQAAVPEFGDRWPHAGADLGIIEKAAGRRLAATLP